MNSRPSVTLVRFSGDHETLFAAIHAADATELLAEWSETRHDTVDTLSWETLPGAERAAAAALADHPRRSMTFLRQERPGGEWSASTVLGVKPAVPTEEMRQAAAAAAARAEAERDTVDWLTAMAFVRAAIDDSFMADPSAWRLDAATATRVMGKLSGIAAGFIEIYAASEGMTAIEYLERMVVQAVEGNAK